MLAAGCSDSTGPVEVPPFLAIVSKIDAVPQVDPGAAYTYHVKELSGTIPIDTTITVPPRDTVIMHVPTATYLVTLAGLPTYCSTKDGPTQGILVPPNSNTSIVRYFITCRPSLTIITATDGMQADSQTIFGVSWNGGQRTGILGPNDTLPIQGIPSGPVLVELESLKPNCQVTTSGGRFRNVTVDSTGGSVVDFRIVCSDPDRQPKILSAVSTYHEGVGGLLLKATDPEGDLERYAWDVTDCRRQSVLPSGIRTRRGLSNGVAAGPDTITVMTTFEVGLPDDSVAGKCAAVYVGDEENNISTILEQPLVNPPGNPPSVVSFNARFNTTQIIETQLEATDPDGDFLGVFVAYTLRDGTIGSPDGAPDFAVRNATGFLGQTVPALGIGNAPLLYENFYSEIIYLFDAAGHFTKVEDPDLFN